jgi:hypothetical protein
MFNVLVWPGGTEIGLEICHALGWCKEVRLHSAGSACSNHGPFAFSRHQLLPSISEPDWLDQLVAYVEREGISHIIPAHDDIVLALAEKARHIPAKVVTSPLRTCRIARYKSLTYRHLRDVVLVPRVYGSQGEVDQFPVFVKPDAGQGSNDAFRVSTRAELTFRLEQRPDSIITDYLSGPEYTVDCFTQRGHGLVFVGGRERVRTRAGISMSSHHVDRPEFAEIAQAVSSRLEFHGAWFFQLKEDHKGRLVLLEVAPRVAGTMAVHRVMGVNFPLLGLYESENKPLRVLDARWQVSADRCLMTRYAHNIHFENVYVDLDDTLIVNGRLNLELVRLLYQFVEEDKRLLLLTKHRAAPRETLSRHRLAEVFDEIIHLTPEQNKADFITRKPSILIDDSFSERLGVHRAHDIPTFDSSSIEVLVNVRR